MPLRRWGPVAKFLRPSCSSSRMGGFRLRGALPTWHCTPTLSAERRASYLPRVRSETRQQSLSSTEDTIYALSTAQGRAGIAVIRISGAACLSIYQALCPSKVLPKPRYATVRSLFEPSVSSKTPRILDSEALVLYFQAPKTVTGEDVLELHVHGGPATIKAVLDAIPKCAPSSRVRYAEPGEFTKRAFFHNRLDLAQIESLSDTLAAETEQQRRTAIRGSSGALSRTYEAWRQQLLHARAEIEALIDFSEDQHFDESQTELLESVTQQVTKILDSIALHELGSQRSELLRTGIRVALLGPPNVGKSSLTNLIVGREASIVSGEAGTTRDIVEASLDVRGYLCSFADTAGFRSTGINKVSETPISPIGEVEAEGIRRAKQKAIESDVIVVVGSVEESKEASKHGAFIHYDEETLALASRAQSCLIVVNKCDMVDQLTAAALLDQFRQTVHQNYPALEHTDIIDISCQELQESPSSASNSNSALQSVIDALVQCFAELTDMPPDLQDLLGVTERQRQLLSKCHQHLEDFLGEASPDATEGREADAVVAAEYLRYAAGCLSRITGKGEGGDVEDVLGVVFEKFCVGK